MAKDTPKSFIHDKFDKAMEWMHKKGGFKAEMLEEKPAMDLIDETYRVIRGGVGQSLSHEVPEELSSALLDNTFIFSGFKTYHELKEASELLRDENGGFKTFEEFRRDVEKIDDTYNRNYLNAEYNFAVQSTQMAVKWHEFEKNGDGYLLQYRTAGDDKVRAEHAALDRTTLPMSDPFWEKYYPPLGWNCRCTAVQVRKGKYPESDSAQAIAAGEAATSKPKQRIFRFNPGKTMKVFPPKHPYLPKGCGNCELKLAYDANNQTCIACKYIRQCLDRSDKLMAHVVQEYENGGKIEVYYNVDESTDDYKRILSCAHFFAKAGKTVVIASSFRSPQNCPNYDKIFGALKGTKYYGKCPDFKVDEVWYEHEGFETDIPKNALKNMLKHGLKQSDRIVIEDCGASITQIHDKISSILKQSDKKITEVWIRKGNKLEQVYKKAESQ